MSLPKLSYTIWFSQRTGSTWFCEVLAATGVAGRPAEFLNHTSLEDALKHYGTANRSDLIARLHMEGMTPNGIFGIKQGYHEPAFSRLLDGIAGPDNGPTRLSRWERAFPNHRHIFMTRRNKLRLAVSWWRAIQSQEWHRRTGDRAAPIDLADKYDANAIDYLMQQAVLREAGLQEMFTEADVAPLTIVYEDAVMDLIASINATLRHLGLPAVETVPPGLSMERISDSVSEEWVQRFRIDRQAGWTNPGW